MTRRPHSTSSTAPAPAATDGATLAAEIAQLRKDLGLPARPTTRHTTTTSLRAELAEVRRMMAEAQARRRPAP
jgi:hypothetical protein